MQRSVLNIWCKDGTMAVEVQFEGIACPASKNIYHLERKALQEIFEHTSNLQAMALDRFQPCSSSSYV